LLLSREDSHLPDLFVVTTASTSWEGKDSNLECSGWKLKFHCSTVALTLLRRSIHLLVIVVQQKVTVGNWSIFILATSWEESGFPLKAIDNNMLFNWVVETNKSILLLICSEFSWVTFDGSLVPVISVVSVECLGIESSPFIKWYPEFTLISSSKISLLLPLWSPKVTILRPWSSIFGKSPWVSHLDDFVLAISIGVGKAHTLKDTIGVASNKVVVTDLTSSSHWVICFGTVQNHSPKLVIRNLIGIMRRDWHTSKSSESFTWISGVKLGVVNIDFSESLLKENQPPSSSWRWFGVDWRVLSDVIGTEIKNWDSIINDNTNFFSSEVEIHFESSIRRIFGILEDTVNS